MNDHTDPMQQDPEALAARATQRQIAEARMRLKNQHLMEVAAALTPAAVLELLHELGVHQIELEMQNEELRATQIALDAARDRYFDLYDLAPVGYFTVGEHGAIRQANLTAASTLGLVRSDLHNQTLSKFIAPEDQDIYYLHRKILLNSEMLQSFELRMVKGDGTVFWAHLTMTLALDADDQLELRIVLNDVNDRKQLQQSLLAKNAALGQAIVVADNANQAKSDFLSSMSHELRTPLHAILGFGQLLSTNPDALQHQQNVDQILKAGWHLLELINEILDLAVIESGKINLAMEPASLPEMIDECKNMIEPMAQQRSIAILVEPADVSCAVMVDRMRFKQVLINLLSNAIKYNLPDGRVSISCAVLPAGRIRIAVADTGKGLSAEKRSQLFEPFNRLGQELRNEEGAGIGLVVCKRLTELMGGAIGVESTEGQGSVFWIELNRVSPLAV